MRERLPSHSPNGIDEGTYVKIGGIDQWIQIRGKDRNSPVLLCLPTLLGSFLQDVHP